MSIRRTARTRRVATAVSMTAALALAVTACGSDDGGKTKDPASSSSSSTPSKPSDGDKGAKEDTSAGDNVDPNVKLAEVKGQGGLTLVINQVKRDSGGFVTVQGEIKNEGQQSSNTAGWAGAETAIVQKNPNSVVSATLVDKAGRSATTSSATRIHGASARRGFSRSSRVSRHRSSCSSRLRPARQLKLTSRCRPSPPPL